MSEETLKLGSHETVTVRESTPDVFEVEVRLAPGKPPPPHFHPAQDEHFQVIEGELRARVAGRKYLLKPGEMLTIPQGTVHQMWNPGETDTRAVWQTTPALRTREWFGAIDKLVSEGRVARNGLPGPLALATLLTRYRDVIKPAVKPRPLVFLALRLLAPIGRLRGY